MHYFYLYVFILICFIISVSYYNTLSYKEAFNAEKQTFVLLGDSIFKNDAYVSDGKSVEKLLEERTNGKTKCLAIDEAKIIDIYDQIERIPEGLNDNFTTIFLSVGGNDILTYYVEDNKNKKDASILNPMFSAYKKVVKNIQAKFPKTNIVLLDIYYPDNLKYKQYQPIISEWNNKIYKYAEDPKNNIASVLKISTILTSKEDFSFGIEPSSKGGEKMVSSIVNRY